MSSTQARVKISYAICVRNEGESLRELLDCITSYKNDSDEIVIINDYSDNEIVNKQLKRADTVVNKKLLNDYGSQKNIFFDICKGNYIFNLDADELPSEKLIQDIKIIISNNSDVDLFRLARRNYIIGNENDLKKVKWKCGHDGRFNWPDPQGRIYKNTKKLYWCCELHETIHGYKKSIGLPSDEYYLIHTKKLENHLINNEKYKAMRSSVGNYSKVGVVCCYFNHCNYVSKLINFIRFSTHLHANGISPLVVESYSDDSLYRVNNLSQNVISVKNASVYWQKEALINIGIQKLLDDGCEYIMWLDTDIEFLTKNFLEHIINSTKFHGVSQVFRTAFRDSQYTNSNKKSTCYHTTINPNDKHKVLFNRIGDPGYGYCYHRNYLTQNLLFDKAVVGTGDFLNLIGLEGVDEQHLVNDRFFKNTSKDFINTYINWTKNNKKLQHGVGYANVDIKIYSHGSQRNRQYTNREKIIKKHNFQPSLDLIEKKSNVYTLTNSNLESGIHQYFLNRKEDDDISSVEMHHAKHLHKLASVKNSEFILNQPNELVAKPKHRLLVDYKIKNDEHIVVAVKTTTNKFSINRVSTDFKILIDTSSIPCLSGHLHNTGWGVYSTYLSFICMFYDKLPKQICFVNENIQKHNHISIINKAITNIQDTKSLTPITGSYSYTRIDQHKKIKNYTTPRRWWSDNLRCGYTLNTKYLATGNFIIPRDIIYRHPKSHYSRIVENIKKETAVEECMIRLAFLDILR
jgi:glycosyltransferase involved in cell wall biosynthesis